MVTDELNNSIDQPRQAPADVGLAPEGGLVGQPPLPASQSQGEPPAAPSAGLPEAEPIPAVSSVSPEAQPAVEPALVAAEPQAGGTQPPPTGTDQPIQPTGEPAPAVEPEPVGPTEGAVPMPAQGETAAAVGSAGAEAAAEPLAEAVTEATPAAVEQSGEAAPVAELAPTAVAAAPAESAVEDAAPTEAAEPEAKRPVKEAAPEPLSEGPKSDNMQWYILKVQSNREDSIREGLMRRVAIAGLGQYFGEVIVPVEKVVEFRGGKRRVTKRKLYPGYLVVQMEINEDTWFLVRETPGIGDFTGAAGHPTPMLAHEVSRILAKKDEKTDEAPKPDIKFRPGDRVKINEGTFENFEGEVDTIDQTTGRVTVMINIFGRSTPVELGYWQIETV